MRPRLRVCARKSQDFQKSRFLNFLRVLCETLEGLAQISGSEILITFEKNEFSKLTILRVSQATGVQILLIRDWS